ncbi:ftsK/SpoIIIE family protein [Bordetella holmesii 70147]|nr:ftsK/SpoIIIE family protein [Bordetella holmesii 70147]EWM49410.1 ftsK/SpoIIIE family protein [Bordetella holmesii 35009]
MPDPIVIAKNAKTELALLPALANRHGCITGATGTGKTVTLQLLAESFSRIGTPVFLADVKGDLTGIAQTGAASSKLTERLSSLGLPEPVWGASPVALWDVFGEQGTPVRATVSDMGPLLLARMLELNPTQEGVLALVFKVADDEGQLLLDMKDLRAMLQDVTDRAAELKVRYGNVSAASVGAIQRALLQLESQGADHFFGEPMLDVADLMRTDARGHGVVNILAADKLMQAPRLYGVFLLWLLADLYEKLPEAGDLEQPKLVFFFDEAHLLFSDAPGALLNKIEQVVRLVRSKGVGIYFVTQNPWIFLTACLGSWVIGCSTRCARLRRAIRRPSKRPPRQCDRSPAWTSRRPSPNWGWAKRWCRCSMPKGGRRRRSAPGYWRRAVVLVRPPIANVRHCAGTCRWQPSTSSP